MTKKKKDVEKTVEEVTDTPRGLFKSRISTETYELNGTEFTIEALPKTVKLFTIAKFQDVNAIRKIAKGFKEPKKPTKKELARLEEEVTKKNMITNMLMTEYVFRLGCISIKNLVNEETKEAVEVIYETVKINGVDRKILPESMITGLPDELVAKLGARILNFDTLTKDELSKLDFTESS